MLSVLSPNIPDNAVLLTVTTPLSVNRTHIGIVGVQARSDYFQSLLMSNALCNNKTFVDCFIITEAGLILLNNQGITLVSHNALEHIDCI